MDITATLPGKAVTLTVQKPWQRIILLLIMGFEGLGGLTGGAMLMASPDGSLLQMPVEMMRGAFADFLIPGILLFALGLLTLVAFFAVLQRRPYDWLMAALSIGGFASWFWVEVAILQDLHWLLLVWGLPVAAGCLITLPMIFPAHFSVRRTLLFCGIISSIFYFIINIIVAAQWPGYSHAAHTVSELSAIGAPTRLLWLVLSLPYTFLVTGFGFGVWQSAAGNKRLRLAAGLLITYGLMGGLWIFAPMHLREELAAGRGTLSDTMHLVLAVVTELIFLTALWLAAFAMGKGFRIYSSITFLVLLVFGLLTFRDAPGVEHNTPTPWIGLWERINIGVFLLWIVVLAVVLWNRDKAGGRRFQSHIQQ